MDNQKIPFKAETQQLLNILINSLYADRDVFLRELISNASDAITKMNFEMLTNHDVTDADSVPEIRIRIDKENRILSVSDNGIGMNAEEMGENLGTIARSGARSFLEQNGGVSQTLANDLIGQFGVGFYAAFMTADFIEVRSRSYRPSDQAARWSSDGAGSFNVDPCDKTDRGTEIRLRLKEDALEYLDEGKVNEIVRKHSNYIPYPIFVGDAEEQANAATTIWRESSASLKDEDYNNFYQNYSMDFEKPLNRLHLSIDAPFQMYALLYVPNSAEKTMFSARVQDGLQLYARKVLIQDYCTDLLPRYYRFMQGVIDSEDIPLNVSRESMQANRVILTLKKIITGKVTDMLKKWGIQEKEQYADFWKKFGPFICEGIITEPDAKDDLMPLLRYRSVNHGQDWISLDDYALEMKTEQTKIYYLLGENLETLRRSPHTETLRKTGIDILLMTDPFDPFVASALGKFRDFEFVNAASAPKDEPKKDLVDDAKTDDEQPFTNLFEQMKNFLGEKVSAVRSAEELVESPARLVDADGAMTPEMQRMMRMMNREYAAPKKILEINTNHAVIQAMANLTGEMRAMFSAQIYDDALIMDGETPDQMAMLERIRKMMSLLSEK